MVKFFLGELEKGAKIELILNVLIFSDKSGWKRNHLTNYVEFVEAVIDPSAEQNILYQSYNPILAICLFCESLAEISENFSNLSH